MVLLVTAVDPFSSSYGMVLRVSLCFMTRAPCPAVSCRDLWCPYLLDTETAVQVVVSGRLPLSVWIDGEKQVATCLILSCHTHNNSTFLKFVSSFFSRWEHSASTKPLVCRVPFPVWPEWYRLLIYWFWGRHIGMPWYCTVPGII